MTEGYVPFGEYKTYYKIFGKQSAGRLPILILHGGPGSSHHYLLNLRKLSQTGRQVIFYDQFGSGNSTGSAKELEGSELFIEQLNSLRTALRLSDIHLIGHSWGGMLAIDYLLTKPKGVHSAVLSSAIISIPLFQAEVDKLVKKLPKTVQATLHKHEKAGSVDNKEYEQAYKIFHDRHIYPDKPWPAELTAPPNAFNKDIYRKLWGLSESYTTSGKLKNWDRIRQLSEINIPVLITSGKYDEVTPRQARVTHEQIPGSKKVLFNKSSHMHTYDEEKKYLKVVSDFFNEVEMSNHN